MMNFRNFLFILLFAGLVSCGGQKEQNILDKVDVLDMKLKKAISEYTLVASLDHHRMAKQEGAYTPPAIASIFSDAAINTQLISNENQLIGLDLPFKVLTFSEADTTKASLAYTSVKFIAKRHGLPIENLSGYSAKMKKVLGHFDKTDISETNLKLITNDFGIVKIQSDFDFGTTVENLVQIVNSQSDTRWFGEIDYQMEARDFNKELNPTKLLLFGGPAPGAKAMMTTPKIGLDAFCQKLLVYENLNGEVWIAFNDIVAFSKLYYNTTTKPQQMINQRLITTFTKAVRKQAN